MSNLTDIIRSGFCTCGLSPFSPDVVNFNILNKKKKNGDSSEYVNRLKQ